MVQDERKQWYRVTLMDIQELDNSFFTGSMSKPIPSQRQGRLHPWLSEHTQWILGRPRVDRLPISLALITVFPIATSDMVDTTAAARSETSGILVAVLEKNERVFMRSWGSRSQQAEKPKPLSCFSPPLILLRIIQSPGVGIAVDR